MKRVKCYGRMKTACVDTSAKKAFFGDPDDNDSLWDLSAGSEQDSVPEKVVKKSRAKRKVDYADNATSLRLFYTFDDLWKSQSVSDSDENTENQIPVKPKIKSRKGRGKKIIKKKIQTTLPKPYISANVNEPRWSSISDHSLFVEKATVGNNRCEKATIGNKRCEKATIGNKRCEKVTVGNKKRNVFPIVKQSKRSPLASNIQNQPTNHKEHPKLTQLGYEVDISSEKVGNNAGLKEQFVPPSSNSENQTNILKEPLNSNFFNSVTKISHDDFENENQIEVNCVDVNLKEYHTSNLMTNKERQTSIHEDQINSILSDSTVEKCPDVCKGKRIVNGKKDKANDLVQNSTPLLNTKKYDVIARLSNISSPDISCISQSSCTQLRRFKSTIGSCRKNCKFVTSTPTVSSNKRNLQKISLLNLSQIPTLEKDCNFSKKISSGFSRSPTCFQSRKYNRNTSVSFLQNKTRSLDGQLDSSKLSHKQSHFSSSCVIQPTLKSKKSYSCLEKILPEQPSLISCTDINQSQSVIQKLTHLCGQETIIPFATAYDWSLVPVRKIGEGTYGEVFMLLQKKKSSVIKIIPVSQDSTNTWLNVETVYSEVKVCQCLSGLRNNKYNKTTNFSKLNSVHFVKGCYPHKLLSAWDTFSTAKTSYNIRPDCFDEDQLYVILELEYGGKDMTSFVMKNAVEAESILKQIAISLAIGEETHLFEHRDLHLGNILVQRVKKKAISFVLRGVSISIPSQGVMVTIIDFTLSRVFDSGCIYYNNLADDESLFNQTGDYQFDIYRATRDNLKNQWHECSLFSNVLWLTFLCVKMKQYQYSRPSSLKHLKSMNDIALFQSDLKSCKSAFDCLKICKILTSIPKSDQSLESKLNGKAVFVDRKSLQKSKLSIRN